MFFDKGGQVVAIALNFDGLGVPVICGLTAPQAVDIDGVVGFKGDSGEVKRGEVEEVVELFP